MGPTHHFLIEGPGGINAVKQSQGYYSQLPIWAPVFDSGGQVFNVKSAKFGALGNGISDDTASFNLAIAAATASSAAVFIPNGTYVLNPTNLGNITSNFVGQSMNGVVLKIVGGYNATNNLIRCVSQTSLVLGNFTLDGNKSNQSGGTNYGFYLSTTTNCVVYNLLTKNFTGVGTQFYNNTRASAYNLYSTANTFHGFEFEQNVKGTYTNLHGYSNTLHGVLVSPGEVGGTGSHGNVFSNVQCDGNGQYGLAFNAANADVSAWLSEGDVFNNVSLTNNTQYGLNIYKQDKQTFNGLYIANNGFFGIYLYQSQYNTFNGFLLHNNSQASNGAYDEIKVQGYADNNAHASKGNTFANGKIIIDGAIKAAYAYNEDTANDGPNTFVYVDIPSAGSSGTIHQLCGSDILSSPGGVVQIGDNGQSIPGANAGFDSAFNHVLRLYNNFTSGSTQIVTPNGNTQFYSGGTETLDVNNGNVAIDPGTATAAGGTLAIKMGTAAVGIYWGSGLPSISAAKGSLYLRTDGSSTSTRMYVNTDGATTWTNLTSAA